jgi:hypothetical protein
LINLCAPHPQAAFACNLPPSLPIGVAMGRPEPGALTRIFTRNFIAVCGFAGEMERSGAMSLQEAMRWKRNAMP